MTLTKTGRKPVKTNNKKRNFQPFFSEVYSFIWFYRVVFMGMLRKGGKRQSWSCVETEFSRAFDTYGSGAEKVGSWFAVLPTMNCSHQ